MKNISEKQFTELSKQAFMDASISRKANMDKFNYKSDPILQQNDQYVSLITIYFNFSLFQKIKECKLHPESQNYFNKLNSEISKPERPKKKFIGGKDCLNKEFSDITPKNENIPHRRPDVSKEYEERLHQENNRNAKTNIRQSDNIFNFEPAEKERPKKKQFNGEFPSKYYKDFYNRGMLSNQLGENVKPQRKYEGNQNKDNIKFFIGENSNERIHKKVDRTGKTNVQELFENSEVRYPPKYKEPTPKPGSVTADQLIPIAKSNIEKIGKNGKNKRKIDF